MNNPRKCHSFHYLFLGGFAVCCYFWWHAHDFAWTHQLALVSALVAAQFALYIWYDILKRPIWPGGLAGDVVFFVASFGLALAVAPQAMNEFWWVRLVYMGMMFAILPLGWAIPLGTVAGFLYLPITQGWDQLSNYSFGDWFGTFYPIVLPAALGLVIRQLNATNKEQARLIEELQTAKKALELARDREGELATLRERERLARDLHDTLGHHLVTLTVQLEAAQRLLAVDPPRVAPLLEDMQKLSRSSMDELRRSLDNLRASGLGNRPLVAALQTLCVDAGQRLSIAVDCQLAAGADALPAAVAEVLWRVAQEGLTNVGQHAQAHRVIVNLNLQPKEIILRVADDGLGLTPGAEDKPGHYGLRGLRERVEGLGGTFTLTKPEGGGAVIEARIPIIA
jgi:signal transduction histidine kinase